MKKLIPFLALTALLFAGCSKSDMQKSSSEDGIEVLQTVTFTANLATDQTKAYTPKTDGAGASVNRCVIEVYRNGNLYKRDYSVVDQSTKKAVFSLQLPSNRTYDVLFWADCVTCAGDTPTDAELQVDNYYVTASGLHSVSFNGSYAGNDDKRDAFFGYQSCEVTQSGTSFTGIELKRPFAQMNVITTDVKEFGVSESDIPTGITVCIKNPYTVINVQTGALSGQVSELEYNGTLYDFPSFSEVPSVTQAKLSMDYIFASDTQDAIDITWTAKTSGASDIVHEFSSIPYKRNYKTNIIGNLLTSMNQWTVTVVPTWGGEVEYKIASSLAEAQEYVQTSSATPVIVEVSQDAVDNATASDVVSVGGKNYLRFILKTTSPYVVGFKLPEISDEVQASLGVDTWLVTFEPEYPTTDVTVDAPAGTKVKIEAPTSHVEVTGTTYAEITASTGDDTLVVPAGTTVDNLIVNKGGLEIHGTVTAAQVVITGSDEVYVRDCENLSQSVYDALKDYIDTDNGYVGAQNSDQTWNIYVGAEPVAKIGDKLYYVLSKAFAAAQADDEIIILKNVEISSPIIVSKNITLNLDGKTITCSVHSGRPFLVQSNTTFTLEDGVFVDGTDDDSFGVVDTRISGVAQENVSIVASNLDFGVFDSDGNVTEPFNTDNGSIFRFRDEGCTVKLENVRVATDHFVVDDSYGGEVVADVDGGKYVINHPASCEDTGCGASLVSAFVMCGTGSTFDGVVIECSGKSVCVEAEATYTACTFTAPEEYYAIALSGGGTATVNSGTYSGGNAVRVLTSGGTVDIQGGTFKGVGENSAALFANVNTSQYSGAVATINVHGGNVDGAMKTSSSPCYINLYGGVYSVDPATTDATVPFGCYVIDNEDPVYKWAVVQNPSEDAELSIAKTGSPTLYSSLSQFRDATNAGNSFEGYTITLLKDIDLNNEEWTPISNYAYGKGSGSLFAGTFDGGNHTVSNLKIENNTEDVLGNTSYVASGFFAQVATCTIKNLVFSNANVSTAGGMNAVVASLHTVSTGKLVMDKVKVLSGSVNSSENVGGLTSYDTGWSEFTDCENSASVTGYSAGGIAGVLRDNTGNNTCRISGCVNNGHITGVDNSGGGAGGIAGKITNKLEVSGCVNNGEVSVSSGSGNIYCGGIAGVADSGNDKTFVDCVNYANVTSDQGSYGRAGGIVGKFSGQIVVSRCVNIGAIKGYQGAGGIVGWSGDSWGLAIDNSYSSGNVSASNGNAGGIDQGEINQTVTTSLNKSAVACGAGKNAWQISNSSSSITSCYYYDGTTLKENSGTTVEDVNAALDALNSGLSTPFWGKYGDEIKPLVLIQ